MTKRTNWRDIAEFVGIAAIVASLLFIGMQMQLDRKIAVTQAYMDSAAINIELTQVLNENRDVWIRGLKGEQLTEIEESTFQDLAYAIFLRKVAIWQRRTRLNSGNPNNWTEEYAYELYVYPGLRRAFEGFLERLRGRRETFNRPAPSSNFSTAVEEALTDLDNSAAPKPEKLTYTIR